jgi:hypothetical protein
MSLTRRQYIEQIRRQIYGGPPSDDATITVNLVNQWLNQAIGVAAKTNYKDSITLDGIAYVNDSFYTTFKGIAITVDENFLWKVTLPHLPMGLGANNGVSTLQIKENTVNISQPVVWLTQSQRSYYSNMRNLPNKILAYMEGEFIFIITPLLLSDYTASVTMVSGGSPTNLDATLNIPPDYMPIITDYLKKELLFERSVPVDDVNDGRDATKEA